MFPFCFGEDDTVELFVDDMILQGGLLVPHLVCRERGYAVNVNCSRYRKRKSLAL